MSGTSIMRFGDDDRPRLPWRQERRAHDELATIANKAYAKELQANLDAQARRNRMAEHRLLTCDAVDTVDEFYDRAVDRAAGDPGKAAALLLIVDDGIAEARRILRRG